MASIIGAAAGGGGFVLIMIIIVIVRCNEDDYTTGRSSSSLSSPSSPSLPSSPSSLPSRLAAKARSSGSGITRHSIGRRKSRGFSQLQEDDHAEEADAAEEKAAAVELDLTSLDVVVSDDLLLSPSSSCSSSHQTVGNTGDGDACAGDRGDGDGDGVGGSGGSGSGGSGSGGALYRTLDTELTGEEATSPTMGPPVEGGDEEGEEDAALAGNLAAEESNDGDFTVAVELSADGEEGVDGEGKHTEGGDVPGEEGGGAVGGTALTRVASTMGEFEV